MSAWQVVPIWTEVIRDKGSDLGQIRSGDKKGDHGERKLDERQVAVDVVM